MKNSNVRRAFLSTVIVTLLSPIMLCAIQGSNTVQVLRKRSWDMLWGGAHSSDAGKRAAAMEALGLLDPSVEVVRLAQSGLKDKQAPVRKAAATSLGQMHSTSSIPALNKALSDSDISVALAAARSLLQMNQKSGYRVYYAVLTGKRQTGQSLLQQQLNQFNTPDKMLDFLFNQGIGFLPYAGYGMEVIQDLQKKDNSPVRAAAAWALANDPSRRSGRALVHACFDKDSMVRTAALRAVAARGDPSLLPGIQPAMQASDTEVQYVAAAAVLRLATIELKREKKATHKAAAAN